MKVGDRWEHAFKPSAQQKRELAAEHNLEYQARQLEDKSLQAIRLEMTLMQCGGESDVGPRGLHKPDPTNAKRAVIGLPDYTELKQVWPERKLIGQVKETQPDGTVVMHQCEMRVPSSDTFDVWPPLNK